MNIKGFMLLLLIWIGALSTETNAQTSCEVLEQLAAQAHSLSREEYGSDYFIKSDNATLRKFISNLNVVVDRDTNTQLKVATERLQNAWIRIDIDTYADALRVLRKELLILQDQRC